jgi:hypothetical protein
MDQKIVQWVQCDNQLKEYNDKMKDKMKPVKEMRDKLEKEIIVVLDVQNKDKSELPTFNIQALNTTVAPTVTKSYESYTNKFYKECFGEYFGSDEKADDLIKFMKNRRKVEKKFTLKRDILMNIND